MLLETSGLYTGTGPAKLHEVEQNDKNVNSE